MFRLFEMDFPPQNVPLYVIKANMFVSTRVFPCQTSFVREEYIVILQCVSLDFTSLIIYPEIKATEALFQSGNMYLCSFCFRITKLNW